MASFAITLNVTGVRAFKMSSLFLDQLEFSGLEVLNIIGEQREGARYRLYQLESTDFVCECYSLSFVRLEAIRSDGKLELLWDVPAIDSSA